MTEGEVYFSRHLSSNTNFVGPALVTVSPVFSGNLEAMTLTGIEHNRDNKQKTCDWQPDVQCKRVQSQTCCSVSSFGILCGEGRA